MDTDGQFRLHDVSTPAPFDTACLRIPITESEYFLVVSECVANQESSYGRDSLQTERPVATSRCP